MRAREGGVLDAQEGTVLRVTSGVELRGHAHLVEDQNKGPVEEVVDAISVSDQISMS